MILRLSLAVLLGGVIGFEREFKNRPAGLRTHVLVTLGAALIMLISMYGFKGNDPARLAAQVVSGIGFLGAGTIMRDGVGIRGLTTAASIWVCGGIGLALGNGYYGGALVTTFFVLLSLIVLGSFERKVMSSRFHEIRFTCRERWGLVGDIGKVFSAEKINIVDMRIEKNFSEKDAIEIVIQVNKSDRFDITHIMDEIMKVDGIKRIVYNKNKLDKEEIE